VNGPFNYVGDGSITDWIKTLEEAKKLKPDKVCPGHGPTGDASVLDNQQEFFKELLAAAKPLLDKSPADAKSSVEEIRNRLKQNGRIARYVGDGLAAQLEKALLELGGKRFLSQAAREAEERKHVQAHGHDHDHPHPHSNVSSPSLRRSK
jgi:hypothetical protein